VIVEERNKAAVFISASLAGMLALFLLWEPMERREVDTAWPLLAGLLLFLTYTWGCSCLAKSKGHSSAIVLTAVFGLLPPLIVLVLLPDVNRHLSNKPRRPRRSAAIKTAHPGHTAPTRGGEEKAVAGRF
jgi:hypothetical protein